MTLPIILLTGFLGAGKTTVLNHLLVDLQRQIHNQAENGDQTPPEQRVAVVLNEFGTVNIDHAVLESDHPVYEVNQGSLFCICTRVEFFAVMKEILANSFRACVIEATGLASPCDLQDYLRQCGEQHELVVTANICVVDAVNYLKVRKTLPAVRDQVRSAAALVVNKVDLVTEEQLSAVQEQLRAENPHARIITASYGRIDWGPLLLNPAAMAVDADAIVRPAAEAVTLQESGVFSLPQIQSFLTGVPGLLRAKGFVRTADGTQYVEYIVDSVTARPMHTPADNSLVLIVSGSAPAAEQLQAAFRSCRVD